VSGNFDFDLFVSHASEDKDAFVRPLVEALTNEALAVWYDETELVPGCSLFETVERGLARSRFGVLVLSHAFFAKRWPRKELNALTARAMATGESVLLPVWLGVSEADVRDYAPLLADVFAIRGDRGVDYTAARIRSVVRPQRSPVTIAREILSREFGVATPPPGDPWWLDAIESAAEDGVEGTFQHSMAFGRWSFPLPPPSQAPDERARRFAQAVMRNAWVEEAERRPITPITPPNVVHEFIAEFPGLRETAVEHWGYLAAYAPQLTIPGLGGNFEPWFDEWVRLAREGRPPYSSETIALHADDFLRIEPATVTCTFCQGELMGPPVKPEGWEIADYAFWLLSDAADWLPATIRDLLHRGMGDWAVWPWVEYSGWWDRDEFGMTGALASQLYRARERGKPLTRPSPASRADAVTRATAAVAHHGLPNSPEVLAERLFDSGWIEAHAVSMRRRRDLQSG
jgi:TIR domain